MIRIIVIAIALLGSYWLVYTLGYKAGCQDGREHLGLPPMDDQ